MFRQAWHLLFRALLPIVRNARPVYWSPAVIFATTQVYIPMHIVGRSMQPTLNPNTSPWTDVGLFQKAFFQNPKYQKGDIIVLRSPGDAKHKLVKRIVGTEWETVQTLPPYPDQIVHIPEGHIWVEGDEPFHSDDSNLFGPVPLGLVESKLSWIAWPPSRFGPPPPRAAAHRFVPTISTTEEGKKSKV